MESEQVSQLGRGCEVHAAVKAVAYTISRGGSRNLVGV